MQEDKIIMDLHEVVGYYLTQPIATLLEQIENAHPDIPHFHSVVYLESSFSAAVIPIVITYIESFVDWAGYLIKNEKPNRSTIDSIKYDYKNSELSEKLKEILCVRDVITHAYIWKREVHHSNNFGNIDYSDFNLHEGYGIKGNKFKETVDINTAKTKLLGLSVIPTRVTKTEIQIVLKVLINVIEVLEERVIEHKQENSLNISGQYVVFQGKVTLFTNLLREFVDDK
ncbi:hypothetical protein [Paenibacillus radicis (ex Xue et al. 2023)]|uniref:RiboL-PSP-HEPN domain-containing protein n=1 Tax=Paenibacillus radicis (ex Xue et al. 2023) TaxID=2972489 RepID=A0ABT1YNX2_9BACL|nr:hypothetical protein [Paenibacillus radicis (ex Xue et al. 2023)]MCR8634869.1 hypothetical protein [Paenibacillus radicis (ex Xue et al. 2023)]